MKQLYTKITGQAEALKGLWVAKLNLQGRSALATPADLQAYDFKKTEVSFNFQNFRMGPNKTRGKGEFPI